MPPRGLIPITLGRFSPTFLHAHDLGVKVLGPTTFARMTFDDVSVELLDRLVAEFAYTIDSRPPGLDDHIVTALEPLVARWRESYAAKGCTLSLIDGPDESLLIEGPLLRPDRILRVKGLLRRFLKGCESPRSEELLLKGLARNEPEGADGEAPLGARAYGALVDELCFAGARPEEAPLENLANLVGATDARGWVYRESGRVLSLPVSQTQFVKSPRFQLQAACRRYEEPGAGS
jgi:hypothetical protein